MTKIKTVLLYLMSLSYVVAGLRHFSDPAFYLKIMPPYLPWHAFLVAFSGVCEIALGLLLLVPKYRRWAAWGLIALLIAVFPANLQMALNPQTFPDIPPVLLWLRLPLQGVLIAWAYWYTRASAWQQPA